MKAIVHHAYGSPDLLELRDVEQPVPKDDELLVRVRASSVNPADWYKVVGVPYLARLDGGLRRPKNPRAGLDFAGRVEAVGATVTLFQPGDDVFGSRLGAYAEFLCVRETKVVRKPTDVTDEQAAAVPVAGLTALQALRDTGRIRAGQRVLVNGAAGGVGTYAVQIAASFGAHVTAVCSTANVDLVRSLGAAEVVDYTREDFSRAARPYDLILDNMGDRSIVDRRRALHHDGILVAVGGPKGGRWLGPGRSLLKAALTPSMRPMISTLVTDDLRVLAGMLAAGTLRSVISKRYPLSRVPEAFAHLGAGHTQGKIVIAT